MRRRMWAFAQRTHRVRQTCPTRRRREPAHGGCNGIRALAAQAANPDAPRAAKTRISMHAAHAACMRDLSVTPRAGIYEVARGVSKPACAVCTRLRRKTLVVPWSPFPPASGFAAVVAWLGATGVAGCWWRWGWPSPPSLSVACTFATVRARQQRAKGRRH